MSGDSDTAVAKVEKVLSIYDKVNFHVLGTLSMIAALMKGSRCYQQGYAERN